MTVDFTPVLQALLALASAAVTAAIPIVVTAVLRRLKVANDTDLAAKLDTALNAAAGEAYRFLLQHSNGVLTARIQDAALAMPVANAITNFQGTLNHFGMTNDAVERAVSGRLGTLLAGDPTVAAPQPPKSDLPATAAAAPVLAPAPVPVKAVGDEVAVSG